MSGLHIKMEQAAPDVRVLRISGELEGTAVLDAKPELFKHLAAIPEQGTLILDLGEIDYVDSSAVGV